MGLKKYIKMLANNLDPGPLYTWLGTGPIHMQLNGPLYIRAQEVVRPIRS